MKSITKQFLPLLFLVFVMLPGCCGNSNNGGIISARDITAFTILGIDGTIGPNAISLTVPYGTSLTALTPTIIITGASVSPASGKPQDFSSPVIYTVTAADGSTKEYTVTVTAAINSAKDITAFSILGIAGTVGPNTVSLTVPYGTSLTALTPTITITGASASPASGEPQDFSSPVTYTVTAADASTKTYIVTVTAALNSAKDITAFSILGIAGTIGPNVVNLTVPYGTSLAALTPTITITGASVSPASGVPQNFTAPVVYTVTAADASTKAYTVTVTAAINPAKDITAFSILGIPGTIGTNTVSLTVPYGNSLTSLTPTITITGASVSPASGVAQDFSSPVTYTVTGADSTTKTYTVTITVALNSAKDITAFSILGVAGTIGANTISLTVPYGADLTALTPTITITGASVSPASGVPQNFTSPVVYTVTAANATTHDYVVTVAFYTGQAMLLTSSDGGDNLLGELTLLPLIASDAAVSFLKFEGTPYQYLIKYIPTGQGLVFNSVDNKFYGVLDGAGVDKVAVLMNFDPATDTLTMLKSFVRNTYPDVTGVNGESLPFEQPNGFYRRPLLSPDGKALLLRTSYGGVDDRGVLIHVNIDPASANYLKDTIVYSFFEYEKDMGNYCQSLRTGGDDRSVTEMAWGKDLTGNAVVYMGVQGLVYDVDITTNPTCPKNCDPYTYEDKHLDRIKGRVFSLKPTNSADLSKPWSYSGGYTPFDPNLALGRQIYWDTKKQAIRWTTEEVGGGLLTFYEAGTSGSHLYFGLTEQCYRLHGLLPQDSNGNSIAMCSGLNGSTDPPDSPPRIFRYTSNDLLSQQAVLSGWYADKKFFRGATSSLMSRRLFVNGGDISDNCVINYLSGTGCKNPSTIEELDPMASYFQNVLVTADEATTGVFFLGDPAVGGSIREPIADRYVVWLGANVKGYTGALNKYDRATGQTTSIPLDPINGANPDGRLLDLGNGQALGMLGSTPPVANEDADPEYKDLGGYGGGAGFHPSTKGHFLLDLKTGKVILAVSQNGSIREYSRERVKLDDGTLWEAIVYYYDGNYYRAFNKISSTDLKLTWIAEKQEDWSFPRDSFALAGRGSVALYLPFWKANFDTAKHYADVTLGCVRADNNVIFESATFGPAQAGMGYAHRIVYGATYSASNNAMYMATAKVGDADLGTIFEIDKNIADADVCKAAPVVTMLVTGLTDVPSTKIEVMKSGELFYGTANGKLMQLDVAGKQAVLVADLKGVSAASSQVKGYLSEVSDNVVALVVYDYNASGQNIARRLVTVNLSTAAVSSRDVTNLIGEFEPYPGVLRLN